MGTANFFMFVGTLFEYNLETVKRPLTSFACWVFFLMKRFANMHHKKENGCFIF